MIHDQDHHQDPVHKHHSSKVSRLVGKLRGHSDKPQDDDHNRTPRSECLHFHKRRDSRFNDEETAAQISLQLWDAAYTTLKNDFRSTGLVLAYEGIIAQELPDDQKLGVNGNPGDIPSDKRMTIMNTIASTSISKGLSDKATLVDDSPREILVFARETVADLSVSYPSAALAWAGICTLTPFLLDPLLKHPDIKAALLYLMSDISRFMAFSQLLLQQTWKTEEDYRDLAARTRQALLDLYRKILELEMNCVCAAASSWNMAAKNVVDWKGWDQMVQAIRDSDAEVSRDLEAYGTERATKQFRAEKDEEVVDDEDGRNGVSRDVGLGEKAAVVAAVV
ncbi:hypothetical protein G7046_g6611 [Stylonectria norvegica]|nr:hypothetical protein G7046_g6611 [Stylonectria norvegica]